MALLRSVKRNRRSPSRRLLAIERLDRRLLLAGDVLPPVDWDAGGAEGECPAVACGATTVEAVNIGPSPTGSFHVVFTAPMAIESMINDGSIFDAVALGGFSNGSVNLTSGAMSYDEPSQTLTWTTSQVLTPGFYRLELAGGMFRDQGGTALAGGTAGLEFQVPAYDGPTLVPADGNAITVDDYSVPSLVDWNGDKLLDLLVGEKTDGGEGKVRVYLNNGTAESPSFSEFTYAQRDGGDLAVSGSGCLGIFPRVLDWDGDGLKDLLVGRADGKIEFYPNVNTDTDPQFGQPTYVTFGPVGSKVDIHLGARATFDVVDWNSDGSPDLVAGSLDGRIRLYLNQSGSGLPDFPEEQLVQDGAGDLVAPSGRSSVAVFDLDGDDRKDLLVGNTNGELLFYANVGTDGQPAFDGFVALEAGGQPIDLDGIPRSRPAIGDFNADGIPDLLVGAQDGLVRVYAGNEWNTAVERPTEVGAAGQPYSFVFRVAGTEWQNLANPLDVTGDGQVEAADVQRMFEELNSPTFHQRIGRRLSPIPDEGAPCFLDVNGDGYCTPLDVLLVINHLNAQTGQAEGEAVPADFIAPARAPNLMEQHQVAEVPALAVRVQDASPPADLIIGAEQPDQPLAWDEYNPDDASSLIGDLEVTLDQLLR